MAPPVLPPLLSLRDILRLYGLTSAKRLGQHFLLDPTVLRKLTSFCPDLERRLVVEVGPGPGGLTRELLNRGVPRLLAIERDRRFHPALQMLQEAAGDRLAVVYADALQAGDAALAAEHFRPIDPLSSAAPLITGNLPFNISGPLLVRWLRQLGDRTGLFAGGRGGRVEVMVQKEVADRMVASPGSAEYGRLSVLCQHLCATRIEYVIPRRCFVPAPEVDGAWVSLQTRDVPLVATNTRTVERFCTLAFSKPRKACRKALLTSGVPEGLVALLLDSRGLTGKERFQELPLEVICHLAAVWEKNEAMMQADPYFQRKGRPRVLLPRAKDPAPAPRTSDAVASNP